MNAKHLKQDLNDFCRMGEAADQLFHNGHVRDALKAYQNLHDQLSQQGDFDSYLIAKLTLGTLLCHMKLGDFKQAYSIWNADIDSSLYGVGIYALENAQTALCDMITYDLVCAFLHTLADSAPGEKASAVNLYLSRVCDQAYEDGDRSLMNLALSNWKQHLREIFPVSLPHEFAQPLIRFEKIYGETVKPQALGFASASSWERPTHFREMSHVVQLRGKASRKETPHPHATRQRVG